MPDEPTTDNNQTSEIGADDIVVPEENKTDPFKRDAKGRLLPGHKGGPGRPKGKSLKEYWKQRLANMTDEEKEAFSKDVQNEMIWKMCEGNPSNDTKVSGDSENPIFFITKEIAEKNGISSTSSTEGDSEGQS